jgi:hypothetical protein
MIVRLVERLRPFLSVALIGLAVALAINLSLSMMARVHLLDWLPDRSTGIGFLVESRQRVDGAVRAYRSGGARSDRPLAAFVGISDVREGVRLPVVSAAMGDRWRLIGVAGAGAGFPAIVEQGSLILNSNLRPDVVVIGCSPLTLIDIANLESAGRAVRPSVLSKVKAEVRSLAWLPQRRSDINAYLDRSLLAVRLRLFSSFGLHVDEDSRSPWRPLLRTLGAEHYPDAVVRSSMITLQLAGADKLQTYKGNAPAINEIGEFIHRVRQTGAQVIIVEMPLNPLLSNIVPRASRYLLAQRLRDASGDQQLQVFDFSDAVASDGFIDLVHLNTAGGERFSAQLGRRLNELPTIRRGPGIAGPV